MNRVKADLLRFISEQSLPGIMLIFLMANTAVWGSGPSNRGVTWNIETATCNRNLPPEIGN